MQAPGLSLHTNQTARLPNAHTRDPRSSLLTERPPIPPLTETKPTSSAWGYSRAGVPAGPATWDGLAPSPAPASSLRPGPAFRGAKAPACPNRAAGGRLSGGGSSSPHPPTHPPLSLPGPTASGERLEAAGPHRYCLGSLGDLTMSGSPRLAPGPTSPWSSSSP